MIDTSSAGWATLLGDTEGFAHRWEAIQAGFVDEPRRAVEEADSLVADVVQRLVGAFAAERERLDDRWNRGDDVDTEELRVTLQHYRRFFDELLGVRSAGAARAD